MTKLANVIMSILFLSGKPVEESIIREKLEISQKDMKAAVNELMSVFCDDCGINLLRFNGKLQFSTNPNYVHEVEAVLNPIKEKELTNAMLETLAIIAYKQPVTRLEVEEVRAVDCTYAVQNLTRLGLIETVGRKETIGKPLLFATTDEFLKRFSIGDVTELPDYESLLEKLKEISYGGGESEEKPMFDTAAVDAQLGGDGEVGDGATDDGAKPKNKKRSAKKGDTVSDDTTAANIEATTTKEAESESSESGSEDVVATVAETKNTDAESSASGESLSAGEISDSSKPSKRRKKAVPPAGDDGEFPEEEIPDFLKGEDVDIIE